MQWVPGGTGQRPVLGGNFLPSLSRTISPSTSGIDGSSPSGGRAAVMSDGSYLSPAGKGPTKNVIAICGEAFRPLLRLRRHPRRRASTRQPTPSRHPPKRFDQATDVVGTHTEVLRPPTRRRRNPYPSPSVPLTTPSRPTPKALQPCSRRRQHPPRSASVPLPTTVARSQIHECKLTTH